MSIDLSKSVNKAVKTLEDIIKYEAGSNQMEKMITEVKGLAIHLESNSLKNLPTVSKLINERLWGAETFQMNGLSKDSEKIIVEMVIEDLDKLTKAALVNHLIEPYKKTL